MNKTFKKAFTLSEVVVAVAILGTLAALTIPTFFSGSTSQKNQYVTGLRKVYSELTYATDQIKTNNAGTLVGAFTSTTDALNKYGNTLKVRRICAAGAVINTAPTPDEGLCWNASTLKLSGGAAVESFDANTNYQGVLLADGSFLLFNITNTACDGAGVSLNLPYASDPNHLCGSIVTDVNGFKGPNQFGRDIFMLLLGPNGLSLGGDINNIYNSQAVECSAAQAAKNGYGCAAKVIGDGKMLY